MHMITRGLATWIFATTVLIGCEADAPEVVDSGPNVRTDARSTRADARSFPPAADAQQTTDAAAPCDDPNESNDTSATASLLVGNEPFTDCDSTGGTLAGAVLNGDEDWFTYTAEDVSLCTVDPTVTIATGNVEVCLFVTCTGAATELTCPVGATAATDGALVGCCSSGEIVIDTFNCVGVISDDATSHIKVRTTAVDTCESYSISYHY